MEPEPRPDAPPFYSHALRVIAQKIQHTAIGQQILRTLSNSGVKPEELKWSGLGKLLQENPNKKFTNTELIQHLQTNTPKLEETVLGKKLLDMARIRSLKSELGSLTTMRHSLIREGKTFNHIDDQIKRVQQAIVKAQVPTPSAETRYGKYVLPGGTNYHEMLVKMPQQNFPHQIPDKSKWNATYTRGMIEVTDENGELAQTFPYSYSLETAIDNAYDDRVDTLKQENDAHVDYQSSHWPNDPNVLGHVRFNDRYGPNGEKLLHLEELQSDWHQEGRDRGYQGDPQPPLELNWDIRPDGTFATVDLSPHLSRGGRSSIYKTGGGWFQTTSTGGETFATLEDAQKRVNEVVQNLQPEGQVADAPFKKNWHEYLLKRMIRHAAENGYDAISWTPGEEQAKRYSLSNQIAHISWVKNRDGTYDIGPTSVEGEDIEHPDFQNMDYSKLVQTIGRDAADKIVAGHGAFHQNYHVRNDGTTRTIGDPYQELEHAEQHINHYRSINPEVKYETRVLPNRGILHTHNLTMGGEGMKGFYDKIVPQYLNNYGKKFGAQVGTTAIAVPKHSEDVHNSGSKQVPVFPITDKMKDSVMHEGQAMFQRPRTYLQLARFDLNSSPKKDEYAATHKTIHNLFGHDPEAIPVWQSVNNIISPDMDFNEHVGKTSLLVANWLHHRKPKDDYTIRRFSHGVLGDSNHHDSIVKTFNGAKYPSEHVGSPLDPHLDRYTHYPDFETLAKQSGTFRDLTSPIEAPKKSELAKLLLKSTPEAATKLHAMDRTIQSIPHLHMAYEDAVHSASNKLGWTPQQVRESIWTTLAGLHAHHSGADLKQIRQAMTNDTSSKGWQNHESSILPSLVDTFATNRIDPFIVRKSAARTKNNAAQSSRPGIIPVRNEASIRYAPISGTTPPKRYTDGRIRRYIIQTLVREGLFDPKTQKFKASRLGKALQLTKIKLAASYDAPLDFGPAQQRVEASNQSPLVEALRTALANVGIAAHQINPAIHDIAGQVRASVIAMGTFRDPRSPQAGAAWAGMIDRQPGMVAFTASPEGPDAIYHFEHKNADQIRQALDQAGVASRVLVPGKTNYSVYLYDKGQKLRPQIASALVNLGVTANEWHGQGDSVGGNVDDMGRGQYRAKINESEQNPPQQMARRLINSIRLRRLQKCH